MRTMLEDSGGVAAECCQGEIGSRNTIRTPEGRDTAATAHERLLIGSRE